MKKNIIIAFLSIALLVSVVFQPVSLVTRVLADSYASVQYTYNAETTFEKISDELNSPAGVHGIFITPYPEDGYAWAVTVTKEPPE